MILWRYAGGPLSLLACFILTSCAYRDRIKGEAQVAITNKGGYYRIAFFDKPHSSLKVSHGFSFRVVDEYRIHSIYIKRSGFESLKGIYKFDFSANAADKKNKPLNSATGEVNVDDLESGICIAHLKFKRYSDGKEYFEEVDGKYKILFLGQVSHMPDP